MVLDNCAKFYLGTQLMIFHPYPSNILPEKNAFFSFFFALIDIFLRFSYIDIFLRFSYIHADHKQSRLSIENWRYLVEVSILTPNSQVSTISILGIGIVPIPTIITIATLSRFSRNLICQLDKPSSSD